MSFTIADMMQMEPFANFKLIAGTNGIGRTIETTNILLNIIQQNCPTAFRKTLWYCLPFFS